MVKYSEGCLQLKGQKKTVMRVALFVCIGQTTEFLNLPLSIYTQFAYKNSNCCLFVHYEGTLV